MQPILCLQNITQSKSTAGDALEPQTTSTESAIRIRRPGPSDRTNMKTSSFSLRVMRRVSTSYTFMWKVFGMQQFVQ